MSRLTDRLAVAQGRATDLIRSRKAADLDLTPTAVDFAGFGGARQILVVTSKRSGQAIPSPVYFGRRDDRTLYFRSDAGSGKIRRIRNNPRVVVVPCRFRGQPSGPVVVATARIVTEAEALDHISGNWNPAGRVIEAVLDRTNKVIDVANAYVELTPE